MIKKYNEYIAEKLSDKLSGFNEEELKQQLLDDKIDIFKYIKICDEYKLPYPSKDELKKSFKYYSTEVVLRKSIRENFADGVKYALEQEEIDDDTLYDILMIKYRKTVKDEIKIILINKCKDNDYLKNKIIKEITLFYDIFELLIENYDFTKDDLNKILIKVSKKSYFYSGIDIRCVIKKGADIHYNNDEALYNAVKYNISDNVETLLKLGAIITDEIYQHIKEKKSSNKMKDLIQKYYDKQND